MKEETMHRYSSKVFQERVMTAAITIEVCYLCIIDIIAVQAT